jgi:uncharacterized protein
LTFRARNIIIRRFFEAASLVASMNRTEELFFDSQKFVRERSRIEGRVALATLPRLGESVVNSDGALDYTLECVQDRRDRTLLRLRVQGKVQLQCQRCLEAMPHEVNIDSSLRPVAAEVLEQEYDDDPDEPDCIAHSRELDLAGLIEDEVILALPPYPRHTEGQCAARKAADVGDANRAEAKILAFNALKALKGR